jgi:hypothetical protein
VTRLNYVHEKESAVRLLEKLKEQRKSRWEEIVEKTNFTYSSRKAWNLLKNLGTDAPQTVPLKTGPANNIAFATIMCFQDSYGQESPSFVGG